MKKQRTIWLSDDEYRKLKNKASEYFSGKGYLEKYLRKIGNSNLIFIEGSGIVNLRISSI